MPAARQRPPRRAAANDAAFGIFSASVGARGRQRAWESRVRKHLSAITRVERNLGPVYEQSAHGVGMRLRGVDSARFLTTWITNQLFLLGEILRREPVPSVQMRALHTQATSAVDAWIARVEAVASTLPSKVITHEITN